MSTAVARRTTRVLIRVGIVLILLGLAPLLSAFFASWIADASGCLLNEGSANSCIVGGMDIGGGLYTMFVMGWLLLLTIWLVPIGVVVLLVALIQWLVGRKSTDAPGAIANTSPPV